MKQEIPAGVTVTYQAQYRKCGKSTCRTCLTGPGHGKYVYLYFRQDGRMHSRYVGKLTPEYVALIAAQRHNKRVTAEVA